MTGERVHLRIGSVVWSAWSDVEITRSIEQVASTAALAISGVDWERWTWITPTPSSLCEIRAGGTSWETGKTVLTGYIDADDLSTSDGSAYRLEVRSRTQDLVDCSCGASSVRSWEGATLARIAEDLARPFGLEVVTDVITAPLAGRFRVAPTDAVAKALEKPAKQAGLLLTDDPTGRLLITTAAPPGPVADTLERGRNIEQMSRHRTVVDRYSRYTVRGQSATEIAAEGEIADPWIVRNRVLVLNSDRSATSASCRTRAQWEAMVRAGKSVRYEVTLGSWRMTSGELWRPNVLVRLVDPVVGVDDELLVAVVKLRKTSNDGTRAVLTLAYPDAYLSEPVSIKARGYRRKAAKADAHAVPGWWDSSAMPFGDPNEKIR